MDFQLSDEQQQLVDAVRRWTARDYSFEHRQSVVRGPAGHRPEDWQALAGLGLTALAVPAAAGGFDGGPVDLMAVVQALAPALLAEPFTDTLAATEVLRLAGGREPLLARVAEGGLTLALALGERQSRHDVFDVATTARADGDGFVLDGVKTPVVFGAQAGLLLVSARLAGGPRERDGLGLFLLDPALPGVQRQDFRTIDGRRACTLALRDVRLAGTDRLDGGPAGPAAELLEALEDHAIVLACAEGIGLMEALLRATQDYLRTRQQFGAPLSSQQALRHRMADMFVQLEQARSLAMLAAVRCAGTDRAERRRACAAAKALCSEALQGVGESAVQLHGGIGVTDELVVSHWFKRASMLAIAWGDAAWHLQRFAALPAGRAA